MPRAMMRFSHLTPEEALQVFDDIGARRLVAGRAAEALGLLNDTGSAPMIGKMVASHAAAAAAVAPDDARAEVNPAAPD